MKTTKIYKQGLDDGETLCTPKDVIRAFPESADFMKCFEGYCVCTKVDGGFRVYLFTNDNQYGVALIHNKDGKPYCFGWYSVRKIGIMESWHRGNDMIDGYEIEETLQEFARLILKHELLFIGKTEYNKDNIGIEED